MTRRLLPAFGLAGVLDALLSAHRMRPGLAPGDALAAVVESAREAEEVALAEGWDGWPWYLHEKLRAGSETLAGYLQRALAGHREEHRLRVTGEQTHARLAAECDSRRHEAQRLRDELTTTRELLDEQRKALERWRNGSERLQDECNRLASQVTNLLQQKAHAASLAEAQAALIAKLTQEVKDREHPAD